MGLRNRLRGRRNDEADSDDGGTEYDATAGPGLSSTMELTEFAPRQDGDYHCAERNLYLRFARPIVTESEGQHTEPARGEFTTAGRFTVQRPFSRPVVYTVLRDNSDHAALVVRRTDTATRQAERLELVFEPDEA